LDWDVGDPRVQVVVAVPAAASVTERGAHETANPVEGDTVELIATAPAKSNVDPAPRLVKVTKTWPVLPCVNVRLVELGIMLNPLT
jgi:hypothetical protein